MTKKENWVISKKLISNGEWCLWSVFLCLMFKYYLKFNLNAKIPKGGLRYIFKSKANEVKSVNRDSFLLLGNLIWT